MQLVSCLAIALLLASFPADAQKRTSRSVLWPDFREFLDDVIKRDMAPLKRDFAIYRFWTDVVRPSSSLAKRRLLLPSFWSKSTKIPKIDWIPSSHWRDALRAKRFWVRSPIESKRELIPSFWSGDDNALKTKRELIPSLWQKAVSKRELIPSFWSGDDNSMKTKRELIPSLWQKAVSKRELIPSFWQGDEAVKTKRKDSSGPESMKKPKRLMLPNYWEIMEKRVGWPKVLGSD